MSKKQNKEYYINKPALLIIGKKIREYRKSKFQSIEAFALSCDMDYSQLARMELGQVNFSISYLLRIADALEISAKDLLP